MFDLLEIIIKDVSLKGQYIREKHDVVITKDA
jgi:hypothetical protein